MFYLSVITIDIHDMAKRITGKQFGGGSKGWTWAHSGDNNEPITLRKDHITCIVQSQVDLTNAWLGNVKRYYESSRIEYKFLDSLQDCMFNIGAMIFTPKHATYDVNTESIIKQLEDRIDYIEDKLDSTEFIKYGADEISAQWGILTTQIRVLETYWVKWINEAAIVDSKKSKYELQEDLINLMSKWSYYEYRYYCYNTSQLIDTWCSNHQTRED